MHVWKSLALVFASASASLVLAELFVRLVLPQPVSWLDVYRRVPELPFPVLQPHVERAIDTGESAWTIHTDERGFRTSGAARRAGPEVLALGDSYTFGQGVAWEDTFVGHLEASLGPALGVVNAGVGGHGPTQYRMMLDHLLGQGMRPRLLLVGVYVGNDFHDCVWDKDLPVEAGVAGADASLTSTLKRNLHLYRMLARLYHRFGIAPVDHGGGELYTPAAWQQEPLARAQEVFRDEMGRIAEAARSAGIPLLAVVIPTERSVDAAAGREAPGEALDPELPVRRAGALLDEVGVRWFDATPALAALERPYFVHDGHLNGAGHAALAAALRERVLGMLEPQGAPGDPLRPPRAGGGEVS